MAGAGEATWWRRWLDRPATLELIVGTERFARDRAAASMWFISLVVGGTLLAVVIAGDRGDIAHPGMLKVVCAVGLVAGFTLAIVLRNDLPFDDWLVAVVVSPVVVLGVYAMGPARQDSVAVLIGVSAGGVTFVRPVSAAATNVASIAGTASMMVLTDGWTTPASRIAMLVTVALGINILQLRMLVGVERLARRERAASATLQQFVAPQVARTVLDEADSSLLEPHRRRIAVVFVDLRGFTAFTAGAEPEDVVDVLTGFYDAFAEEVDRLDATPGAYAGDGAMAFFGDPVPCDDPAGRALELARAVRSRLLVLADGWASRGHRLGAGIGVSLGYATLGVVGAKGRREYTPLGSVVNLAARLCGEAAAGEILVDVRVREATGTGGEPRDLELKGFAEPVRAFAVPSLGAR